MTTWTEWIQAYVEAMRHRGHSHRTIDLRSRNLRRFAAFCQAPVPVLLSGVTLAHVSAFGASLQATSKPSAQLQALQSVRVFFRWALRSQRLLLDPTILLVLPHIERAACLFLTEQQVEGLLRPQAREGPVQLRNRTLLETFYGTAVRLHEACALDLDDVNLRDGVLRVRRGKGRHERLVPVGPHLAAVLAAYLEHSRPRLVWDSSQTALFVSNRGDRLGVVSMQKVVQTAGRRRGLAQLGAHALRRSCATHMLAAGADLVAVQQMLGHASVATTERYVQLTWAQVKAEHARTHPRAGRVLPPQT